jgi:CheY-like chemotaxis protein
LGRTALQPRQRDYVDKIVSSGQSLLGILNDILDFSKIEAHCLDLEDVAFSLDEVLRGLSTVMAVGAGAKDVELVISAAPDAPARLMGDQHRLLQVLINLAGNAIKFTHRGQVVVRVERLAEEDGRALLRFAVRDTGIGISAEQQARLFSAFSQADASTTRQFGGTGLGLAICRRLVELMGGSIGVRSTLGGGSEFWFMVALAVAPGERPQLPAAGQPFEVLVVDDNAAAREALADAVRTLGGRPLCLSSGKQALEHLRERARHAQPYDLLLIDWELADLPGAAFCQAVQAGGDIVPAPVAVTVTTASRDEVLRRTDPALLNAILVKPVTAIALLDAVSDVQARHQRGATPVSAAEAMRLEGVRVLVVEDNPVNQQVARNILELDGAAVAVAADGREAVERLRRERTAFDVVLMDVQMPILDGYEATRRVRHDLGLADLPVIALTAGALTVERERARAAGMSDFVAKPFDVDQLVGTILRALGRSSGHSSGGASVAEAAAGLAFEVAVPGIDTRQAALRLGGNQKLFTALLGQFAGQFADVMGQVREDLEQGHPDQAARQLHTLRGAAGNLAAIDVARLAAGAEAAVRDEKPTDDLLEHLDQALSSLIAAIRLNLPAPSAPEADAGPVDAAQLDQLMDLLAHRDLGALDLFERLRAGLRARWGDEDDRRLAQLMTELRFDDAQAMLQARVEGRVQPVGAT